MKIFKIGVHNWKCDVHKAFWIYKKFPSAYYADRYACRITFNKQSPYMAFVAFGEEVDA